MAPCITVLLEIQIAVHEVDDEPQCIEYTINGDIVDVIEQIFLAHLTKLPRIIFTGDEDEQMASLNLLSGLIKALSQSDNINTCLANEQVLQKLTTALVTAVELDRPNHLLQEEHSIRLIGDEQAVECGTLRTNTAWKIFKNLRNQSSAVKIRSVCQLLGRNEHTKELVLDALFRSFCANSSSCNEIMILFQFFVPTSNDAKWSALESSILEELLSTSHWCLGLQASAAVTERTENSQWFEERTEGLYESATSIRMVDVKYDEPSPSTTVDQRLNLQDVKFNVLHMCLILETVACYASHLGDRFQPFLLNSLHRILEKSGSSHYMIHSAGVYALTKLQSALNLNSISELIFQNADYITFHVNRSLRKSEESQSALEILSVVIKYSSLEAIPHLESIIHTVLLESAKSSQSQNILAFLRVFHMILCGVREWTIDIGSAPKDTPTSSEAVITHRSWMEFLRQSDGLDDDTDIDMDKEPVAEDADAVEPMNEEPDDEDHPAPPKPVFIEFTLNILKRCIRYISSRVRAEKLVALDAICVGLDIIKACEDDLLPMVHGIWTPFVERVRDNDPIILRRCFSVLHILAKYARDFIYRRTTE